ncbi:MAG TPA: FHA domain-containing protein [Polyangia bacterium]
MDTDALADLAHSTTREEFVSQQPHQFLVLEQALAPDEQVQFATQVVDPVSLRRSTMRRTTNLEVLSVTKAAGNPYPDRVSVGRARNCDIVMRDPSVSKLHAHFRISGPKLELVDIDSQNGTRVNGKPLAPHQPAPVAPGDTLLFGSVACKLVDAASLYDLLR